MTRSDTKLLVVIGAIIEAVIFGAIVLTGSARVSGPDIRALAVATAVPTAPPLPKGWDPAKCPKVPNFKPDRMLTIDGFTAQTVLDQHGCPALLVLIPLREGVFPSATPTRTPGGDRNHP